MIKFSSYAFWVSNSCDMFSNASNKYLDNTFPTNIYAL